MEANIKLTFLLNSTHLEINQLEVEHVVQMVCDSLKCNDERARVTPLAQLLHRKTMGNPFFVQQLLISFHQEGLIKFDFHRVGCVYNQFA